MNIEIIDRLIKKYQQTEWDPSSHADIQASTSEVITFALATDRPDLMPPGTDSLRAYKIRLDNNQRAIVDKLRLW